MKKYILIISLTIFSSIYAQNHHIGLGFNNFSNIAINYERTIISDFNLRFSFSRSLVDGNRSNKNISYDFSALSAKIYTGDDIFDFDLYHGPGVLVGYYYEYDNFRNESTYYPTNNSTYYQNSSMISPQYLLGFEREFGKDILGSLELAFGAHFLLNEQMTILEKYNLGDWVPYIGFNINIGYNYPNSILRL